jgi:hypothetical protein
LAGKYFIRGLTAGSVKGWYGKFKNKWHQ